MPAIQSLGSMFGQGVDAVTSDLSSRWSNHMTTQASGNQMNNLMVALAIQPPSRSA